MGIIGCNRTRKLGNKITAKECMTERLTERDETNDKREWERIIIGKTWEINICDGKTN